MRPSICESEPSNWQRGDTKCGTTERTGQYLFRVERNCILQGRSVPVGGTYQATYLYLAWPCRSLI
jgi:hypothetical protein